MDDKITIEVVCRNLPGLQFVDAPNNGPVHLGIQKGEEVIEIVPGDRKQVTFRPEFKVTKQPNGAPNFLGPFAKGTPQERFFYLSWGSVGERCGFAMFRRAKIHLNHLSWAQVQKAISGDKPLKVIIDMTDKKGGPLCASVRSDRAKWQS